MHYIFHFALPGGGGAKCFPNWDSILFDFFTTFVPRRIALKSAATDRSLWFGAFFWLGKEGIPSRRRRCA